MHVQLLSPHVLRLAAVLLLSVDILQTKCSLLNGLLKPQVFALTVFFCQNSQKTHFELWVVLSNRDSSLHDLYIKSLSKTKVLQ